MREALGDGLAVFGLSLPGETIQKELDFLEELLRWNQQINLTAIRDPREALEKHLIDSLILLPLITEAADLLDMGSGGGLPGIPLAIANPEIKVFSVDSVGKKINFQKHIKRRQNLTNLHPLHSRLETLDEVLSPEVHFDWIVARAFSSLEQILRLAGPWLKKGGGLLAMKGPGIESELLAVETQLPRFGFHLKAINRYQLPFSRAERQILRFEQR